jgi:hypothetical protein
VVQDIKKEPDHWPNDAPRDCFPKSIGENSFEELDGYDDQ